MRRTVIVVLALAGFAFLWRVVPHDFNMTPMGALAESLYALYSNSGHGGMDFSAIVKMLDGEK